MCTFKFTRVSERMAKTTRMTKSQGEYLSKKAAKGKRNSMRGECEGRYEPIWEKLG
jgi:hypothetical protein